jgi:hypothetical protein
LGYQVNKEKDMRISKGAKIREAKQKAFDEWKAKNPAVFNILPLGIAETVRMGFIPTLNKMFQYQRTNYSTFKR